uniref:Uncharacterized protein n=1 Tax=Arundo donax TaxID=35708 RepID=A0A0A9F6C9_ARUDO
MRTSRPTDDGSMMWSNEETPSLGRALGDTRRSRYSARWRSKVPSGRRSMLYATLKLEMSTHVWSGTAVLHSLRLTSSLPAMAVGGRCSGAARLSARLPQHRLQLLLLQDLSPGRQSRVFAHSMGPGGRAAPSDPAQPSPARARQPACPPDRSPRAQEPASTARPLQSKSRRDQPPRLQQPSGGKKQRERTAVRGEAGGRRKRHQG